MARRGEENFYDVLTAAVADFTKYGYDSAERVAYWTQRIKDAAERSLMPDYLMERAIRATLSNLYKRMVENGDLGKFHPGVGRYTIEKVRPELRAELDRRILASASLIRLNKQQAVEKTLQRFQGWATSIPPGGSKATDKADTKSDIRKALAKLKFEERRVTIDQGHKFVANLNEIVAKDGGAIALVWHSHWRQPGYNYRPDHKDRDGEIYLLKSSWARDQGLVKPGEVGYYDDITSVGEEPFCRCYAEYIYTISRLPSAMLTVKGREKLEEARRKIQEMKRGH